MAKQNIAKTEVKTSAVQSKDNRPVIYALLILLSFVLIYLCNQVKFVQDDSYISFRFVKNFVEGKGLVFNPGEKVEGYTNLLWVLLLSIFYAMKMNIETIAQYLSMGFGILVLFQTYKISSLVLLKEENKKGKASASTSYLFNFIPVVMLVLTGAYNFWAISGMETCMFISFVLAGIFYYMKNRNGDSPNYLFSLFIFLASLTRPEGLYFFGLIIIHKVIISIKENKGGFVKDIFSKNNLITYAVYIVPTGLFMLWRLSYYGYPFPNTAYAKTGFSAAYMAAGWTYFKNFFEAYMLYGVVFALPLFLLKKKENFFEISLMYLLTILYSIYIIVVGGDVLKQFRFFLPILPLIYILFGKFLEDIAYKMKAKSSSGSLNLGLSLALGVSLLIGIINYNSQKEAIKKDVETENGLVEKMKLAGAWFNAKQTQLGRPLVLAATTIGAVSYFSDVIVIDMLGLTDETIAHKPLIVPEVSSLALNWKERKYNAEYVLSRKPDYIYFSTGIKPSAYAEIALLTYDNFLNNYYAYPFTVKEWGYSDVVYKRKSDAEINSVASNNNKLPVNPKYNKKFAGEFNYAMNIMRSNKQEAIRALNSSIETAPPNFGYAYQNLGDVYLQAGNKDEAFKNYLKAIEADSYNVNALIQLYNIYSQKGDVENANKVVERLTLIAPEMK
jgi:tetratricopeptide (TPR) repeat protein